MTDAATPPSLPRYVDYVPVCGNPPASCIASLPSVAPDEDVESILHHMRATTAAKGTT